MGSMDKIQLPTDSEKKCERKLLKTFGFQKDQIITSIDPIDFPRDSLLLTNENTIIFEDKLDGLSCLLEYTKQNNLTYVLTNMFSRGNSEIGKDLTAKASFIKSIPNQITLNNGALGNQFYIRGELIISKENFNLYNNHLFIDSRRCVNSFVINKKGSFQDTPIFNYIEFVAYELILNNETNQFTVFKQLQLLKEFQFQVVNHFIFVTREAQTNKKIPFNENCFCLSIGIGNQKDQDQKEDNLLTKYFRNFLEDWKLKSKYKIDGLIVQKLNKTYIRNTIGNPKYAFAFKCNNYLTGHKTAMAEVHNVEWNYSRLGKIIPRLCLCEPETTKPVQLQNTQIMYVSAKNAKYIVNNNINRGTLLEIEYSGDVIPNIVQIHKSSLFPSLPFDNELKVTENNWQEILENNSYFTWDANQVQFISKESSSNSNSDSEIKKIAYFFNQINCKSFGEETIKRIYESGFQSIDSILKMQISDFLKVPRVKAKLATKLYENMHQSMNDILNDKTKHIKLFNACGLFTEGISIKKLELIQNHFPNFLYDSQIQKQITKESLKNIDSFSDITATKVLDCLQNAIEWYQTKIVSCFSYYNYSNTSNTDSQSSTNSESSMISESSMTSESSTKSKQKTFTFTDFRDDSLKRDIETFFGYTFSEAMTKRNTAFLIVNFTHCPNEFKLKENETLEDRNISKCVTTMAGKSVTSKMKKAYQMKIPVYCVLTMKDFLEKNKK
jgi:NAD-dependent DNA ligase